MSLLLKVEKNSGVNWLRKQTKAINVGKGTCSVSCLSLKNLVIKYFQILFSPSFQGSFRSLQDVGCYGTECVSKQTQRGGWHQKKFKMSKQLKIEIGFLVVEGKVSSSKVRFFVSFYMVGEHTIHRELLFWNIFILRHAPLPTEHTKHTLVELIHSVNFQVRTHCDFSLSFSSDSSTSAGMIESVIVGICSKHLKEVLFNKRITK